jgi:Ca2+-binding EF-hand superfamily protein
MDVGSSCDYDNSSAYSTVTTTTWSASELQNLNDAFELLDTENKGEILVNELHSTLVELSALTNDKAGARNIQTLLASLKAFQSNAKLSMSEFISLLTSPSPISLKDDVEKVFELFDTSGKGYINMQDLRKVAHDLGEKNVSDAEVNEMIQRVSTSGQVTLDQFREIMKNNILL